MLRYDQIKEGVLSGTLSSAEAVAELSRYYVRAPYYYHADAARLRASRELETLLQEKSRREAWLLEEKARREARLLEEKARHEAGLLEEKARRDARAAR